MRYLRQQNINRRAPYDQRLYVDMTNSIVMNTTNHLQLPKGSTSERPASVTWSEGMIRYNSTTHEVEVYQGASATWRAMRFKESTEILKDSYVGDGVKAVFGPIQPQPPASELVQSGVTWTGDNLIVIVGGVYQIYSSNYEIHLGEDITPTGNDPGPFTTGQYYIKFTSASPGLLTPITILQGFDK